MAVVCSIAWQAAAAGVLAGLSRPQRPPLAPPLPRSPRLPRLQLQELQPVHRLLHEGKHAAAHFVLAWPHACAPSVPWAAATPVGGARGCASAAPPPRPAASLTRRPRPPALLPPQSVLARANFENADLSDALMDRAVIVEANLKNAVLQVRMRWFVGCLGWGCGWAAVGLLCRRGTRRAVQGSGAGVGGHAAPAPLPAGLHAPQRAVPRPAPACNQPPPVLGPPAGAPPQRVVFTRSDLAGSDIYGADFTNALLDKTQQMVRCWVCCPSCPLRAAARPSTRRAAALGCTRCGRAGAPGRRPAAPRRRPPPG